MTDQNAQVKIPDPVELSKAMVKIADQSQRMVRDFLSKQSMDGSVGMSDPLNIGGAFLEMAARMMTDPAKLMQSQVSLWHDYLNLWQTATMRFLGEEAKPVITAASDDRRFKDAAWEENVVFDFIKQSYLLAARWLQTNVRQVEGLDDKTSRKVDFYTRQFVDAMAPSNFVMTNPQVLRTTLESGGENLVKGLSNLLEDLERGKGQLKIKMTDLDAFKIGENIAMTKGTVVYQTDLMQLIQYTPTTAEVYKRPLLVVPPWINKFYILDLRDKNSYIKWAVDQGFTVFVISWVNPDEKLANKTFESYMIEGVLAALDAIEQQTGEKEVSAVGYCLGGTLLTSTLAYLAAIGEERIKAATLFTTMLDFTDAGELSVFIDEEQLSALEDKMNRTGYLDGSAMAGTFNMLRANDLIWSFVVNNYLLGKDPFPFDLLFWNSDSTRMPAAMHSFYLRKMYQENQLIVPGALTLGGQPIDLRKIKTPVYFLSAREDHIAPWMSTYAGTQILGGEVKFVLSASGHIAGVVNPPAAKKYCYWVNPELPADPNAWLEGVQQQDGSWWPDWANWVAEKAPEKIPARDDKNGPLGALDVAPGSYVKARL